MTVEIRLLGRFAARRDGAEIPPGSFGGRLARTLLRILVSRRGAFVSREYLTEALWPTAPPANPAMNINVLVQRARRALCDPGLVLTGPGGYSFACTSGCRVDAESFLQSVDTARRLLADGRVREALSAYRQALDIWTGEPLAEDVYQDWAAEYRTLLLRGHLDALEGAAAAALAAGVPGEAVTYSELAVVLEPLRESAHLLLVRSLAASGDPAGALAALARLRARFGEELGLDPSAEAGELQLRILRGEGLAPAGPPAATTAGAFVELPFLGRDAELAQILNSLTNPFPPAVVVVGPAGIGKSRLLAEAGSRSQRPVLAASAFRMQREEPWAVAAVLLQELLGLDAGAAAALPPEALPALTGIVPDLGDLRAVGPAPSDAESRRALAREGAARLFQAIASKQPLVVVDDLQWADATSLGLLEVVARRAPGVGMLFAYRSDEVPTESAVASFLADLRDSGRDVLPLALGALTPEALLQHFGEGKLAGILLRETEGTPLAVTEVLRALAQRGLVEPDGLGRWTVRAGSDAELGSAARAGQGKTIRARAGRRPAHEAEVLSLLALLRRQAPARLLAAAGERPETAVLDDLESLARARLVRLGERGWAPHHDVFGDIVIEDLEPSRRARLHGMLARALRAEGGEPAEIAAHLAGAGDPEAAAHAFLDAARQGLQRFANAEAEELSAAGMGLDPRPDVRASLLEIRAEARGRRGDFAAAREDLRSALATGCGARWRIITAMAMLTSGAEDYAVAGELIELALGEAGAARAARAVALAAAARLDLNLLRLDRAEDRAAEALALFEEVGDPDGVAGIVETRSMIAAHRADFPDAVARLEHAARLLEDAGKLMRVGMTRANLGHGLALTGRPHDGLALIDGAIELERTLGHPDGEAYSLWLRSEVLAYMSRADEARQAAEAALGGARRIGHREWTAAALHGLGAAFLAGGDLDAAEAALSRCLELSGGLPIFESWASAVMAAVHLARGDLAAARQSAADALASGTPMTQLEGHRVRAEIAVAAGDQDAPAILRDTLRRAEAAGHVLAVNRLRSLGGVSGVAL